MAQEDKLPVDSLELDFSGAQPVLGAGAGLVYPPDGFYTGVLTKFDMYKGKNDDDRKLYAYIDIEDGLVRENFQLQGQGLNYLAGLLISAGLNAEKLKGKFTVPFAGIAAKRRPVYFKYTLAMRKPDGSPEQGCYPKFRFMTKDQYAAAIAEESNTAPVEPAKQEVKPEPVKQEVKAEPAKAAATTTVKPAADEDDLDWLK